MKKLYTSFIAVFLAVVLATRYVSLGSIVGTWVLAGALVFGAATGDDLGRDASLAGMAVLVALFVLVKHRSNIKRLRAGTESRFGEKAPETKGESK